MKNQNSQNNNNQDDLCEVFHPHEDSIERAKKHILAEEEYTDLSEFFKIFGNPTRLKIISLLSYEDLCVCDICESFPDKSKVNLILKDDAHYFINEYPDKDNLDIRKQSTNFANIPILRDDLMAVFDELKLDGKNIDAFVLTPLNSNDFPIDTLNYLNSFNVPIYISLQGFLRFEDEDNSMILKPSNDLESIFAIGDTIFLDESEFDIINDEEIQDLNLVITNGSKGSRILCADGETIKINAVKCENIVDATGCGDTYMAAYISARLNNKNLIESGDFASSIASKKLENFGPYKKFIK